MKNKIEIHKIELELLNLRLAKAEAERDNIQKELLALKLLQTKPNSAQLSTGQWRRTTVAAVSVLAFASLVSASVFHDAQSNVKENDQPEVSAISALENGQIVRGKHHSVSDKKPPPRSGKEKTRLARAIEATQRQWGPLLVMPEPEAKKRYYAFDSLVKEQQENLLTHGFDIG
jgi:hypothetical protein